MDKWLYRLKGTVADIFRGSVNVLYEMPKCWAFYGFKYEFVQTLDKAIIALESGGFTEDQKKETVKKFASMSRGFRNLMAKNCKNNEKSKSNC